MTNSINYEVIHAVVFSSLLVFLCCCIKIFFQSPCSQKLSIYLLPLLHEATFYCTLSGDIYCYLVLFPLLISQLFSFLGFQCSLLYSFSCHDLLLVPYRHWTTNQLVGIHTRSDLNSVQLHNTQSSNKESVVQSPFWEAGNHSNGDDNPLLLWNPRFITIFTRGQYFNLS